MAATKRRSFKGYTAKKGIEFDLVPPNGGQTLVIRGIPMIPGSVLLDFLSGVNEDDPGGMARTIMHMIQSAVVPEQWDEFREFIDDPKNGVGLSMLSEIAGYLAESYSVRPTLPQEPSSTG